MKKTALLFPCIVASNLFAMETEKQKVEQLDALNVAIASYNPPLSIMQYNVDRAIREEQVEKTKWNNRSPRIIKLINEVNAGIVCLQELRELPGTPSVIKFLSEFDQYRFVMSHRGPSKLAFGQATLYNPEKAFPLITQTYWLSETPTEVSDTWAKKKDSG